jgi:hypothetical protein
MAEIGRRENVSQATVASVLAANGLEGLSELDPGPLVRRYDHPHPGATVCLGIKKLVRFRVPGRRVTRVPRKDSKGIGWKRAHVAIDDHSCVVSGHSGPFFPISDQMSNLPLHSTRSRSSPKPPVSAAHRRNGTN